MSRCSRLPVIGEAAYLFYAPWVRAVCGVGWTGARRTRLVEHGQQCRRSALCKSREHAPVSAGGGLWARFRGPEVELLYRRENGAAGCRWGAGGGPKTKPAAPSSVAAGFALWGRPCRPFPICWRLRHRPPSGPSWVAGVRTLWSVQSGTSSDAVPGSEPKW